MPSKSKAQHDFMVIASKSKKFADKNKIPVETAAEFVAEDKRLGLYQKTTTPEKGKKK